MTNKNNIEISPNIKINPKELFDVSCNFLIKWGDLGCEP